MAAASRHPAWSFRTSPTPASPRRGGSVRNRGGFPVFAKKGEDAKGYAASPASDGYFLGIGQRIVTRDEYPVGAPISVVVTGMVWVKVGGDVQSGDGVSVNATGEFVKSDSGTSGLTDVSNAKFMTSATSGSYAVVALK